MSEQPIVVEGDYTPGEWQVLMGYVESQMYRGGTKEEYEDEFYRFIGQRDEEKEAAERGRVWEAFGDALIKDDSKDSFWAYGWDFVARVKALFGDDK